jgi:hypothetical protein
MIAAEDRGRARHRRPRAAAIATAVGGAATLGYSTYVLGIALELADHCSPPPGNGVCVVGPPFGFSPGTWVFVAVVGILVGGLLILIAGLLYSRPRAHTFLGFLGVVLALLTIPVYGGAIVGLVAAIVGATFAFAYRPPEGTEVGAGVAPWSPAGAPGTPAAMAPPHHHAPHSGHPTGPGPIRPAAPLAPRAATSNSSYPAGGTALPPPPPSSEPASPPPPWEVPPAREERPRDAATREPQPTPPLWIPDQYFERPPPEPDRPTASSAPPAHAVPPPPPWAAPDQAAPAPTQKVIPPPRAVPPPRRPDVPAVPAGPASPPPSTAPPSGPRAWKCPQCGLKNAPWSLKCTRCGTASPAGALAAPGGASPPGRPTE